MVKQYPHTMTVKVTAEATTDGSGNWIPSVETDKEITCRAEPSSGRGSIPLADGTRLFYDWTVYMPLPVDTLKVGASVTVKHGEEVLSTNTIKRFSRGQLNARVWL
jgi:hypothetical protein